MPIRTRAYAQGGRKTSPPGLNGNLCARRQTPTVCLGQATQPGRKWMANLYQGPFPITATGETASLVLRRSNLLRPNVMGLYDTRCVGMVQRLVSSYYYAQRKAAGGFARNTRGPTLLRPMEPRKRSLFTRAARFSALIILFTLHGAHSWQGESPRQQSRRLPA